MFQCLSGPKMHEKAFYSQEEGRKEGRKEGQNGHVDLHASPQVKTSLEQLDKFSP